MRREENQREENQGVENLEIDIDKVRESAIVEAKGNHNWRQRGNAIICTSCKNRHSFFIPVGKMLIDVKDGIPVLKDKR